MEKNRNKQINQIKTYRVFAVLALIVIFLTVSSCSVIGDIFKAGMGFGIFIVVAIIVVIVIVILRLSKK